MAVARRVLVQVILVIILGIVEVFQWQHLHLQRSVVAFGHLRHFCLDDGQVVRVGVIDARAVLCAHVVALSVKRSGVNRLEIELQQQRKRQAFGVVCHAYSLGKARFVCANLLVRGVLAMSVGISRLRVGYAVDLFQKVFCTPEASAGQVYFCLCVHCLSFLFLVFTIYRAASQNGTQCGYGQFHCQSVHLCLFRVTTKLYIFAQITKECQLFERYLKKKHYFCTKPMLCGILLVGWCRPRFKTPFTCKQHANTIGNKGRPRCCDAPVEHRQATYGGRRQHPAVGGGLSTACHG